MKRVFLLIVVPALLVVLGFAQTPAASGNTDQVNIKGCLGGSDGSYTVAEDNTGKIFKITTSSADLKAYVGQEVNLVAHKAGTAENSVTITEVNMISEHCNAAAAAPAATVSAPEETVSTPPAAAAPAAAAPDATVSTPPESASTPPTPATAPAAAAPDATVSTPPESASTPPAAAATPAATAPVATVIVPAETASAPAVAAPVHKARPSARAGKPAATPDAAAKPAEPVSTPVADAAVPTAAVPTASAGPSPETASTPAAPAPVPKAPTGRSTLMLGSIVVVVVLIGLMVPLFQRWRRRKLLEETSGQNLSFTKDAKSDPGKTDTTGGRKAA